ncbi:MAG TPA: NAD(P)H-binding protein, partial [Candidatus Kapabacteria bacterium]
MNRILVIGGTGNIGRTVVTQLAAAGANIRAMVRDPETAGFPSTVEVLYGDLTLPETLEEALNGIERIFLVWTAPPAAASQALQRITRHARHIVYLSAPLRTPHPFFQASLPNPSAALHNE